MDYTDRDYGIGTWLISGVIATFSRLVLFVCSPRLVARAAGFSIFADPYLKEELLLVLGTSSSESRCADDGESGKRAAAPSDRGWSFRRLSSTSKEPKSKCPSQTCSRATHPTRKLEPRDQMLRWRWLLARGRAGGDRFSFIVSPQPVGLRPCGRRDGADPRRRPLHERMPLAATSRQRVHDRRSA